MIGLDQWRCVVGLFMFKSWKGKPVCKNKNNNNNNLGRTSDDLSDLCGRLFVMAFTFWLFYFQIQGISFVLSNSKCFNYDLLMLSGDVESHPGPGHDTQSIEEMLKHFSDKISSEIQGVKNELKHEFKHELSTVKDSVVSLKHDLKSISARVSNIEEHQELQRLDIDSLVETIGRVGDKVQNLEDATEKQERYSRRENIILHGVTEMQNESYEKIRERVTQILNGNVKSKSWKDSDIQRSHRLGKDSSKKPRPIIVRFHQFQDKLLVLKSRDDLRKLGIGVANDLTKNQRDELAKLKEKGQKGFYKNGVLQITQITDASTNSKPVLSSNSVTNSNTSS